MSKFKPPCILLQKNLEQNIIYLFKNFVPAPPLNPYQHNRISSVGDRFAVPLDLLPPAFGRFGYNTLSAVDNCKL